MERHGDVIWVAPLAELAAREKLRFEAHARAADLEPLASRTFVLRYPRADDVRKLLTGAGSQRVLSKRGSVMADPRTNLLFVTDLDGTHRADRRPDRADRQADAAGDDRGADRRGRHGLFAQPGRQAVDDVDGRLAARDRGGKDGTVYDLVGAADFRFRRGHGGSHALRRAGDAPPEHRIERAGDRGARADRVESAGDHGGSRRRRSSSRAPSCPIRRRSEMASRECSFGALRSNWRSSRKSRRTGA